MTARLLIGTANPGKVAELRRLLAGLDVELLSLDQLSARIEEPPEDAPTYAENARAKALAYARASGIVTVADDSGLEVDALRGAPGVRSKRFAGGAEPSAAQNNATLLAALDRVASRGARFVCVIALAQPDGQVETFDGEVRGEIAEAPRGLSGFGYDPLFIIAGDGRTMAELDAGEKDRISHRGLAAAKLRVRLAAVRS